MVLRRTVSLSNERWCALGIDVEKSVTTAVLAGLDGKILWQEHFPTPHFADAGALAPFLVEMISGCLDSLDHGAMFWRHRYWRASA